MIPLTAYFSKILLLNTLKDKSVPSANFIMFLPIFEKNY